MLPFLKHKKEATQEGSASVTRKHDDGSEYDPMESAAQDLKTSLESGDIKGIAAALRAAFDLADSEPHHEGEHV